MATPSHDHPVKSAEEILKQHGLRHTAFRAQMLEIFQRSGYALSQTDVETMLDQFDRITLYRTLKSFEEKGLIHKISDTNGNAKYALCEGTCDEGHHHDQHVHFHCDQCGKSFCIEEIIVPEVQIPAGYTMISSDMMVNGVCKDCNKK